VFRDFKHATRNTKYERGGKIMNKKTDELYFREPNCGPDCSTPRSARLRERRFRMGLEKCNMPEHYLQLQEEAKRIYVESALIDPGIARALALQHIVDNCDITLEEDTVLLGGEDPFFFNLMLPSLTSDGHARFGRAPDEASERLRQASAFYAACFEGHITTGLDDVLSQGIAGIRSRIEDKKPSFSEKLGFYSVEQNLFWESALIACNAVLTYTKRYREAAETLAKSTDDADKAAEWREAAEVLRRVPEYPAITFREALQSYWIVYILVTLEMGGCVPGGGLGLGRLDQFLYPYYTKDIEAGRLTRAEAGTYGIVPSLFSAR